MAAISKSRVQCQIGLHPGARRAPELVVMPGSLAEDTRDFRFSHTRNLSCGLG